jgi:hypothetical protein
LVVEAACQWPTEPFGAIAELKESIIAEPPTVDTTRDAQKFVIELVAVSAKRVVTDCGPTTAVEVVAIRAETSGTFA